MARSAVQQGTIADQTAGDAAAALGLRRTSALADVLGRPQDAMTIVHVAGTKGKGSTVAFISAMLVAGGHRTGRYTSPHLAQLTERIAIDEVDLDDVAFDQVADRVLASADRLEHDHPELGRVNALEILFLMALVAFRDAGCRVAVIEVGIGGRLDTTNILDPAVSVITTLDLEHTAILGETLAEIAAEKAGIIKSGRPVVVAPQPDEAMVVIRTRAEALGSRLTIVEPGIDVSSDEELGLQGPHQVLNARLAVAALSALTEVDPGLEVGRDQQLDGLRGAWLPGRFEVVSNDFVRAFSDRPGVVATIVLDGAHTQRAAAALRETIESAFSTVIQPVVLCGFASDKDVRAFLEALRPVRVLPVMAASLRAVPAEQIAVIAGDLAIAVQDGPATTADALRWLLDGDNGEKGTDLIVVTGSFLVVAEARAALGLKGRWG